MYKYEIKDINSKKREAFRMVLLDFINLYIKLKIGYPNLEKERIILINLIKQYIKYDNNEKDVLKYINKKYGNIQFDDTIEDLFLEFDEIYEEYYSYIQECISGYESVISSNVIEIVINRLNGNYLQTNNERFRMTLPKKKKTFNDDYKIKVLERLRGN